MVQTQCEPCQSGSQWKGVPGKGGPAIRAGSLRNEGAPRAAPEARALLTSQPCTTDQPLASGWEKLFYPFLPQWDLESSPAVLIHPGISHGASKTEVRGGATLGTPAVQDLE